MHGVVCLCVVLLFVCEMAVGNVLVAMPFAFVIFCGFSCMQQGGAIYATGEVTISNTTFTSNEAVRLEVTARYKCACDVYVVCVMYVCALCVRYSCGVLAICVCAWCHVHRACVCWGAGRACGCIVRRRWALVGRKCGDSCVFACGCARGWCMAWFACVYIC